ncbi:hypothetical protein JX266_003820 [Neoarthrinium moseri]|nr:hypothetical protein JX266_003820 [Neoarthrinium moseri]
MRPSLVTILFSGTVTAAAVCERQESQGCCFHLESVGSVNETVEENHTGRILLGGSFQQGGFCLNPSNGTLKDAIGNNCFMRAPNYEFQCYQGALSTTFFMLSAGSDGKTKLLYDETPGTFFACPTGSSNQDVYSLFPLWKNDTTGCVEITLALTNQTAECAAQGGSPVTGSTTALPTTELTVPTETGSKVPIIQYGSGASDSSIGQGSTRTTDASSTTKSTSAPEPPSSSNPSNSSQACSVASSAPSIAPRKLGFPQDNAPDGIHDTSLDASITPVNSTIFQYTIPRSFATKSTQLCALQFRLPFCSDLPSGYPCFHFSGSEQETLSNSGMVFSLVSDDGRTTWNNSALHQVHPGDKKVFGTFECGTASAGYGERKITWLASSVRNFALEFQQAGVGSSPEFVDGVGAWVVQCS